MLSLQNQWRQFVHDLDPPTRLANAPPGLVVALGMLLIGVALAAIVYWVTKKY
jgi:hypothetical protein